MPWVKFSDDWYDDPELIEAGPLAMLVWPVLVSWCARNLTDGKVPAGQVRRLVDWHALGAEPEQAIAPLIEKGRLQDIAGGYQIVNYLKYQPSREQVIAEREAGKQRAAKSRERAANVQKGSDDPVPVPVPDRSLSSSSSSDARGLPADLWTTVADKKLAQTKGVSNPAAWKRKVIANAQTDPEMLARASWLTERYELTTSHLAECLVAGSTPSQAYQRKETA